MKIEEDVSGQMEKDHLKIFCLFEDFFDMVENNRHDIKILLKMVTSLRWELERHLLVEEKQIYISYIVGDHEYGEVIARILKEHQQILGMLGKIQKELRENKTIESSDFKRLLLEHEEFEKKVFYPKLNEKLNENERKNIVEEMNILINKT